MEFWLSHPGYPWDLLFLVRYRHRRLQSRRRRSGNTFKLSGKTFAASFFKNTHVGVEKNGAYFGDLGPKSLSYLSGTVFTLSPR